MLTVSRVLLFVAVSLLGCVVSGQQPISTTPSTFCSDFPSCSIIELLMGQKSLQINLNYESDGTICDVYASSINNGGGTAIGLVSGSLSVQTVGGSNIITNINLNFYSGTPTTPTYGTLVGNVNPAATSATVTYAPYGLNAAPVTSSVQDTCTGGVTSDPHFSGFLGQQFFVGGAPGAVLNILSASNMQLNSRLVQLEDGESMGESDMKNARLRSANALPYTRWFDHAGTYMGETGLAMLGGRRLYAKAGAYASGFESVQLDGELFPISNLSVVVGEGTDAVLLTHRTSHEIDIESTSVHLTLTNSDYFMNIEKAHLELAYTQRRVPFTGALGQTANKRWVAKNGDADWQARVEKEALVASNDLFAFPQGKITKAQAAK